jgi:CubicO group peptidase (beta-lactamase class C family)
MVAGSSAGNSRTANTFCQGRAVGVGHTGLGRIQVSQFDFSRRRLLRDSVLIGTGAALSGLPLNGALAKSLRKPGPWPHVTAFIEGHVASRKVAGMIAALGWGDAPPQYIARGLEGFSDKDLAGPDSLFRAYSQTKPITGFAAMLLIEEGKLKLDQPIADFAPEFANMKVAINPDKNLESRPATVQITVRHLLTHTAGLGYAGVGPNKPITKELERLGLVPGILTNLPIPGMSGGAKVPDPDEFLRRTASVPLCFEPGTIWRYSMSLDVLGLIIQRAAGAISFAAFLQDRLFGPLDMTSSAFQVPEAAKPRLTTNYALIKGNPFPIDGPANSVFAKPTSFAFGGSGLVTTPADYDRFLALIVNGGMHRGKRLMREETVALAVSDLLPAGADTSGTWVHGNGVGAGGISGKGKDEGLYGWAGAAGTVGLANTKYKLRSGLYTQYIPQDALPVQRDFPKAVGADILALKGRKT